VARLASWRVSHVTAADPVTSSDSSRGLALQRRVIVKRSYNVISPHLDDVAASCALLLAANPGSVLTTVFAGGPASVAPLPTWDRLARYFPEGADVVGVRRGEDISACALVRAKPVHLTYWDRQYRNDTYGYDGPAEEKLPEVIAAELLSDLSSAATDHWVAPLGLGHPDHRIAAEVGLLLAERGAGEFYVYEELPYAAELKTEVSQRRRALADRGFVLQEDPTVEVASDSALKSAVIRCHASQHRLLRRRLRRTRRWPERVWKLSRG
jgi:LmbE family N-acetylglucosaminyl deacetylase